VEEERIPNPIGVPSDEGEDGSGEAKPSKFGTDPFTCDPFT
jgi:hypothetical protein